MKTFMAAALLAVGALATPFAPVASAAPPDPLTDSGCGFTSVTDPDPEAPDETQTGYLHGGPILQSGTLTCTLKVGVATHDRAYVNGASAAATGTHGVTVLAPAIVSYVSPRGIPVYLCEQFTDAGGVTYYWDGTGEVWTTDGSAACSLTISAGVDEGYEPSPWETVDWIEATGCQALTTLAGTHGPVVVNAQGDVFVAGEPFWDCPPYDIDW